MLKRLGPMSLRSLVAVTLALLAWAPPAGAADGDLLWGYYGITLGGACYHCPTAQTSDGYGGTIVAWVDGSGGITVQYLDANGGAHWLPSGRQLATTGTNPSIFGDGTGGATVAWQDSTGVRVQRVDASGTALWTSGGVQIATSGVFPVAVTDGAGGAFVVWSAPYVRCGHVDSYGTPTAPGVNGIALGGLAIDGSGISLHSIYDGTGSGGGVGGVIAVWADAARNIVAQRVRSGLPWGSTPVTVSSDYRDETDVRIAPASPSGVLISWAPLQTYPAQRQVRVQRLGLDGLSAWTAGGVVLVDAATVGGDPAYWTGTVIAAVAPDGGSGAIVAWTDFRNNPFPGTGDIYAQRVNDAGTPLWTTNGVLLPTPFAGGEPYYRGAPWIASDLFGGAIVVTEDSSASSVDITANRVDPDGQLYWSKIVYTDQYDPDMGDQEKPSILYDSTGPLPKGALVAWHDQANWATVAQRIEISQPANDTCYEATPVTTGTWYSSTVGSFQDGNASCGGGSEVWYQYTAPQQGALVATTCGTNDLPGTDLGMDTVLSLHTTCPGTAANEFPAACNDDWPSSVGSCTNDVGLARDSFVQAALSTGQTAFIRVARYAYGKNGPFALNVYFAADACGRTPDNDVWAGTPLTVEKGGGGNIVLAWGPSCLSTDNDYAVYEGHLASYYTHGAKLCSTGGATSATLVPAATSSYYLVVPRKGDVEGSYGVDSGRNERPRGSSVCVSGQSIRRCR